MFTMDFSSGMNTEFVNTQKTKCPICMDLVEESKITTTKCGHQFCCNCVDLWEEENSSCPMCRTQLKEINKKRKENIFYKRSIVNYLNCIKIINNASFTFNSKYN